MDYLPKNELLEFRPNTLEDVRKLYGMEKPGVMKEAVDILDKWIQTQNHFTKKDFSKEYLERIIISSKGSVERSKARLDKLFTLRTLLPKYFREYDVRKDFQNIQDITTYVVLPKQTDDLERVFICKVVGNKMSANLFLEGYRYLMVLSEYMKAHDYARSHWLIVDYLEVASVAEMLAKADLVDLQQAVSALIDGYGHRLRGIHILVNSILVDTIVSIAKQMVSDKLKKAAKCESLSHMKGSVIIGK